MSDTVATRRRVRKACDRCGQQVLWPAEGHGLHRMKDKSHVCDGCRDAFYERCSCGSWEARESMKEWIDSDGVVERMCPACHRRFIHKCSISHVLFDSRQGGIKAVNGRWYSARYLPRFRHCTVCDGWVMRSATREYRLLDGTRATMCSSHMTGWIGPVEVSDGEAVEEPYIDATLTLGRCVATNETYRRVDLQFILSPDRRHGVYVARNLASTWQVRDCGHVTEEGLRYVTPPDAGPEIDRDGVSLTRSNTGVNRWETGAILCARCHAQALRPTDRTSYIGSHGSTPVLVKHRVDASDGPLLGVELEVDKGERHQECAKEVLRLVGQKHVWAKPDGSLTNGIEFVTHPATLNYMEQERARYAMLLAVPGNFKFKSHDAETCGLHVHVDRAWFSEVEQARLVWLTEHFWPELFIFARRSPETAQRWAKRAMTMEEQMAKDKPSHQMQYLFHRVKQGDRYRTLNFQRSPTMEFRLFRGTLNPVTFWATLQLVDNLCRLAKEVSDDDALLSLTWKDVIDRHPHAELTDYNSRFVGDGWNGSLEFMTRALGDSKEHLCKVAVPCSVSKDAKLVKYVLLDFYSNPYAAAWLKKNRQYHDVWTKAEVIEGLIEDTLIRKMVLALAGVENRMEV